jgi:hypothetical protein
MTKFNRILLRAGFAAFGLFAGAPALAAAGDPPLNPVAAADRLTALGVLSQAKPVVMLVLLGLVVAIVYAAFVYIRGVVAPRDRRPSGLVFLSALASGGPLVGLFAAAYGVADMFVGVANVRPTPSLTVLAPGFAEAGFCVTLGLLAGAIATVGHRHLTGRTLGSPATAPAAATPPQPLARSLA